MSGAEEMEACALALNIAFTDIYTCTLLLFIS